MPRLGRYLCNLGDICNNCNIMCHVLYVYGWSCNVDEAGILDRRNFLTKRMDLAIIARLSRTEPLRIELGAPPESPLISLGITIMTKGGQTLVRPTESDTSSVILHRLLNYVINARDEQI